MWTRHKEFAAPVDRKEWLVDGKPEMRTYSVVMGGVDRGRSEARYVPDLSPHERFVECIGGHSFIVTDPPPPLERTLIDRCPSCGCDRMYFGCFCGR